MSRTKNTLKNLLFGYTEEFLIVILSFANRRIFVQVLGSQYNGLNSVISNILSMLNLVELGFGSAIIYSLYKPLAKRDEQHIKTLMGFYKSTYRVMGLIIAVLGLCLMPLLPTIVKDNLDFTNVYFVFALHLLQTISTYLFFAYKRAILEADQKSYLISKIRSMMMTITYLSQMAVLLVFGSYYAYLIVAICGTVLQNIVIAITAGREYPYLKGKSPRMDKKERKEITKNCGALFLYRINSYVQNSTNSLVLANFVSLSVIGYYGHYLTLVNAIKAIMNKMFSSMVGSLGNLHAEAQLSNDDTRRFDREECVFSVITLIAFATYGLCGVGLFAVASLFIDIWIGAGQTLSDTAVLLISLECFIYGLAKPTASFRSSMGLFQQCKYRPLASMAINLALSLILVRWFEIEGVLFGTVASITLTTLWYDPVIIYRDGFGRSARPYFGRVLTFAMIEGASIGLCALFHSLVPLAGIEGVLVNGVFAVIVFSTLFVILLHKLPEFKELVALAKSIAAHVQRRRSK